jgi:hypothetical protein
MIALLAAYEWEDLGWEDLRHASSGVAAGRAVFESRLLACSQRLR